MIWLSPNGSTTYASLLDLAGKKKRPAGLYSLDKVLWLINAPADLLALGFWARRVIGLYSTVRKTDPNIISKLDAQDRRFSESLEFWMAWISKNQSEMLFNPQLASVNVEPIQKGRAAKAFVSNPISRRGLGRHTLYAALFHSHPTQSVAKNWDLLAWHFLISHARATAEFVDQDDYLHHNGVNEPEGLPNKSYPVSKALRDLALPKHKAQLKSVALCCSPKLLAEYNAADIQAVAKDHPELASVLRFVCKAYGLIDWRSGTGGGRGSNTRHSEKARGHIDLKYCRHIFRSEPISPDKTTRNVEVSVNPGMTSKETKKILSMGLLPEELDDPVDLSLVTMDCKSTMGSVASVMLAAKASRKHVVMNAQQFRWRADSLTQYECHAVHRHLISRIISQLSGDDSAEVDLRLVHEALSLLVMLWTGADIYEVQEMVFLGSDHNRKKKRLGILWVDAENESSVGHYEWRINALFPNYSKLGDLTKNVDCRKIRSTVWLPDVLELGQCLERLYVKNGSPSNGQIFSSKYKLTLSALNEQLKQVPGTDRVTVAKIRAYVFRQLMADNHDVVAASMVTNQMHPLANSRLYYTSVGVDHLRSQYMNSLKSDFQYLGVSENRIAQIEQVQVEDWHVGARLSVLPQAYEVAIQRLKKAVFDESQYTDVAGFIRYHNLYTAYSIWLYTFQTVQRATGKPLPSSTHFDPDRGIGNVRDKDSDPPYHARLIWSAPDTLAQLRHVELHMFHIRKWLRARGTSIKEVELQNRVFFLSERGLPQAPDPSCWEKHVSPFLKAPQNAHRNFIRTSLLESGHPIESIDALLGHWCRGEEPWAIDSTFRFSHHLELIQNSLTDMVSSLGFEPLPSVLSRPDSGTSVPPQIELADRAVINRVLPKRSRQADGKFDPVPILKNLDLNVEDEWLLDALDFLYVNKRSQLSQRLLGLSSENPTDDDVLEVQQLVHQQYTTKRDIAGGLMSQLRIIDRGNQRGDWKICVPQVPVLAVNPSCPFVPEVREWPQHFSVLDSALQHLFENGSRQDPQEAFLNLSSSQKVGALLLSAIVRGGVLDAGALKTLLRTISNPVMHCPKASAWIELSLDWRGQTGSELRRWFPDVTSECLIYLLSAGEFEKCAAIFDDARANRKMFACIDAYLQHCSTAVPITSLDGLLKRARYVWKIQAMPMISAIASRERLCHSLKSHCWARLQGEYVKPIREEADSHSHLLEDAESCEEDALSISWFDDLLAALKGQQRYLGKKVAIKSVEKLANALVSAELSSSQEIMTHWALFMLKQAGKGRQGFAPSTAAKYLSSVGKRLAAFVGADDLVALGCAGLSDLYGEVLDDAVSLHHRQSLARGLREFHAFLVRKYKVDPIAESEVLGIGKTRSPVDANLISLDDYKLIRSRLEVDPSLHMYGPEYAQAAVLIFTLGFRCGLRRMEILGLRPCDVHIGPSHSSLLVRPWGYRNLKSSASHRQIPLSELLEAGELQELADWLQRRHGQEGALLFEVPGRLGPSLSQHFMIPRIHNAMRIVTGDSTLRFHHLRHAFCSWALLRLCIAEFEFNPKQWFLKLPATSEWLVEASSFSKKLLGTKGPTRKLAYAVSSILGHASPEVSIQHYFHFADILIRVAADQVHQEPSFSELSQFGPLARSTGYDNRAEDDKLALWSLMAHGRQSKTVAGRTKALKGEFTGSDCDAVEEASEDETFHRHLSAVWTFLVHAAKDNERTLQEICEIHSFSVKEGLRFHKSASSMAALKGRNAGVFRHRVVMNQDGDEKVRGLVPRWPRRTSDQEALREMSIAISKLLWAEHSDAESSKNSILNTIKFWSTRAWQTEHGISFERGELQAMKAYVTLARQCGLTDENVRIVRHSDVSDALRKKINTAVGLPKPYEFCLTKPSNTNSFASGAWITIEIVDSQEKSALRCWRLFLFLLAVVLDGPVEDAICVEEAANGITM